MPFAVGLSLAPLAATDPEAKTVFDTALGLACAFLASHLSSRPASLGGYDKGG